MLKSLNKVLAIARSYLFSNFTRSLFNLKGFIVSTNSDQYQTVMTGSSSQIKKTIMSINYIDKMNLMRIVLPKSFSKIYEYS